MMDSGASMNALDAAGRSVLGHVIENGNLNLLKFLLSRGVDPNQEDAKQNTPLHYSARKADTTMTTLLLNAGASPLLRNSSNQSPVDVIPPTSTSKSRALHAQLTRSQRQGSRVKYLEPEDVTRAKRNTPIHIAAAQNKLDDLQNLLLQGFTINQQNGLGETPGMVAAQHGNYEAFWFLVNYPLFDVNVRDKKKNTILHHAVMGKNLDIV